MKTLRGPIDELAAQVAREINEPSRQPHTAIVIEGLEGSGKTTLGRGLSSRLGAPCLHLDEFLPSDADGNIPWHQHVINGGAVQEICQRADEPTQIIEGISSSRVVPNSILSSPKALRIYNQRMTLRARTAQYYWSDGDALKIEALQALGFRYLNDEREYHRRTQPWRSAHFVLEVTDLNIGC